LPCNFSEEANQLTPTKKLKRATVESQYKEMIDHMYATEGTYIPYQGEDKQEAGLTKEDISLVQGSWQKAAALGAETVGVLLFKHIFEIAPEALQLFSFKNEENLYESPKLKSHAVGVISTVGTAVEGLNDLGALVPVLQGLGKRHVKYGVKPPHYDVVGQAVLKTLEAGLQADFTAETRAAWTKVWGIVATTMIGDNYK